MVYDFINQSKTVLIEKKSPDVLAFAQKIFVELHRT